MLTYSLKMQEFNTGTETIFSDLNRVRISRISETIQNIFWYVPLIHDCYRERPNKDKK